MEPVPPNIPFAWINDGQHYRPAVIRHWRRVTLAGMYNMPVWEATCVYWNEDGEPEVVVVPEARVSKGSGPAK